MSVIALASSCAIPARNPFALHCVGDKTSPHNIHDVGYSGFNPLLERFLIRIAETRYRQHRRGVRSTEPCAVNGDCLIPTASGSWPQSINAFAYPNASIMSWSIELRDAFPSMTRSGNF